MKKCPHCAEEIQDEAIVCRYCGRDLQILNPIQTAHIKKVRAKMDDPDHSLGACSYMLKGKIL